MHIILFLIVLLLLLFLLWVLKENIVEIRRNSTNNWDVLKFLLWSPFICVIFVVLILIVPLGKIYQLIAISIVKMKLGDKYCDAIKGSNALMGSDTWKNSLIKTLVIVKYNKTLAKKDFFEYTKEILERRRSENKIHKKFFSTMHESMGQLFLKNIKIEISDLVRPLPGTKRLDKKELINVLRTCFYQPLPSDGAALWDVYVGTQPLINWRTTPNADVEYYPLFFRTHHMLADGISLEKSLMLLFQDCEKILKSDCVSNVEPIKTVIQKIVSNVRLCFRVCVMFLSCAYLFLLHKGYDSNDLHFKPYKNEEVLQGGFDADGIYFQKVKKIKKQYSNLTFPQILLTAFSASLYEYYQKYSEKCPEYVTMALPIIKDITEVTKILTGEIGSSDVTASNKFTFLQLKLPIDVLKNKHFDKNIPVTSRLNIVGQALDVLKHSIEPQFSHIFVEIILGSLPFWFMRKFGQNIHNTVVGTFLPGPPKLKYIDGVYEISDCLFWIPHIVKLGVGISTITYDNQLAVGFNSDTQVKKQFHADEILSNIYKYIDMIEEEIEDLFKEN